MKSYTDLEQSKKLAEILPLKSADMYYFCGDEDDICFGSGIYEEIADWNSNGMSKPADIPCWSLAALLNAVDFGTINLHYDNARTDWVVSATIHDSTKHCTKYESTRALNPIDACVAMILKLHE